MLEAIRKHAQGWLAKAILGLIALTFAFFGLESYMAGDRSGGTVAEVGDIGITRDALANEVRAQRDRMRESMGPAFDPAIAETQDFRKQVLDSLIERSAMLQEAQKQGILAPDAYVAAMLGRIPAFQEDGKFSQARYEAVLRQNGRSPVQFENELRQEFMLETMASPVTLASFPSREVSAQLAQLVAQQREISWFDIPAASVAAEIKLAPADVQRYYEANKAEFTEPQQIRAEYAVLDLAAVAAGITVSEQAVADYYASHTAEFGRPEQRSASHILIAVDQSADAAARAKAKAKAETLYQTLQKSPERFVELARADSQDPGSAEQGGSLGSFGRGMMVKPFEDAVFDMKLHEIRGPVESDFGYHIIRLDGIEPAQAVPLAQVRATVVDALRKQEAQKRFAELAESFGNLVYENADSLQPAAKATGVAIRQTDWAGVKSLQTPLDNAALSEALFSPESLRSRQNTEAIEVKPGTLVAARVFDARPARLKPLTEVAQTIETKLRTEQQTRLLAQKGEAMIAALAQGNEQGAAWSALRMVGRQPSELLAPAEVRAVFRVQTDTLPAYAGFARQDGAYRIVRITRVLDTSTVDPMLTASIESSLVQAQQRADMKAMLTLVKAGWKVKVKPDADTADER